MVKLCIGERMNPRNDHYIQYIIWDENFSEKQPRQNKGIVENQETKDDTDKFKIGKNPWLGVRSNFA
jgi:hypothetical protein